MPRGDIKLVRFLINNPDGSRANMNFTTVLFMVKRKTPDETCLFQKDLADGGIVKIHSGDYQLRINPEDTERMPYGDYKFDIRLEYEDQLKETFRGNFVIEKKSTQYSTNVCEYSIDNTSTLRENYHTLVLSTPVSMNGGQSGGGGGPVDYEEINNKPTINGVELSGNISLQDLGIPDIASITAIRAEVSKAYKYKGKVTKVSDLQYIDNPQNGDTYDVEDTGVNYAWNATESRWDNFGSLSSLPADVESLSNYDLDIITGSASSEIALKSLFESGGDVEADRDLEITETLIVNKDVTFDLCRHNISFSGTGSVFQVIRSKLTIKNGNINTTGRIAQAQSGGRIITENITVNGENI